MAVVVEVVREWMMSEVAVLVLVVGSERMCTTANRGTRRRFCRSIWVNLSTHRGIPLG